VSELRTIGRMRTSRSPLTLMISFWIGALCVVEILEGRTVGEFYRRLGVRSSRAVYLITRQPRNRDFGHSSARFIMIIITIIIGNHGQVSSSLLGDATVAKAE
jgi:hypothetical protein